MVRGVSTSTWRRARVGRMLMRMHDVVYWSLPTIGLGRVRGFVLVGEKAFAEVSLLAAVSDGCFEQLEECLFVECAVIEYTLAYVELAPGRFKVLMSL